MGTKTLTCSDKFMRTTLCPEYLPKARTRLVFPTPGLPSSNTAENDRTQIHKSVKLRDSEQEIPPY